MGYSISSYQQRKGGGDPDFISKTEKALEVIQEKSDRNHEFIEEMNELIQKVSEHQEPDMRLVEKVGSMEKKLNDAAELIEKFVTLHAKDNLDVVEPNPSSSQLLQNGCEIESALEKTLPVEGLEENLPASNVQEDVSVFTSEDDVFNKITITNVKILLQGPKGIVPIGKSEVLITKESNAFTLTFTAEQGRQTVWIKSKADVKSVKGHSNSIKVVCYENSCYTCSQVLVIIFDSAEDVDSVQWFFE